MNTLPDDFASLAGAPAVFLLLGTTILGFLAVLSLFVSLKRELARTVRRERRRTDQLLHQVQEAAHEDAALLLANHDASSPAQEPASPPPPSRHWRTLALQLSKQGISADQVAETLGARVAEVELFLRVQQAIEKEPHEPAPSEALADTGSHQDARTRKAAAG